jgi:hypothetical protein
MGLLELNGGGGRYVVTRRQRHFSLEKEQETWAGKLSIKTWIQSRRHLHLLETKLVIAAYQFRMKNVHSSPAPELGGCDEFVFTSDRDIHTYFQK